MPRAGRWQECLNTDAALYGGSNLGNGLGPLQTLPVPAHGQAQSIELLLPPLAVVVLAPPTVAP